MSGTEPSTSLPYQAVSVSAYPFAEIVALAYLPKRKEFFLLPYSTKSHLHIQCSYLQTPDGEKEYTQPLTAEPKANPPYGFSDPVDWADPDAVIADIKAHCSVPFFVIPEESKAMEARLSKALDEQGL